MNSPGETLKRLLKSSDMKDLTGFTRLTPLSGGSINEVYRVDCSVGTSEMSLLFKWHADPPSGFFQAEFAGAGP